VLATICLLMCLLICVIRCISSHVPAIYYSSSSVARLCCLVASVDWRALIVVSIVTD